jgi:uncharacterized protein YxeA
MKKLLFSIIFIGLTITTFGQQLLTNTVKQTEEYAYLTIESEAVITSDATTSTQFKSSENIIKVYITNGINTELITTNKKTNTELYYINHIAKFGWLYIENVNKIQLEENITFTDTDKYTICKTYLFKRIVD